MNNYFVGHVVALFVGTLMSISLMSILIINYFNEKIQSNKNKLLKFIFLIIIFLFNIAFAVINLLEPVSSNIYSIVAISLLSFGLFFGIFLIMRYVKKINKLIVLANVFFILSIFIGIVGDMFAEANLAIFIIVGLFGEIVFLPMFVVDFLIYSIGKKKRIVKTYFAKGMFKKIIIYVTIIVIILMGIVSSIFILDMNREITSELVIYSWYDYFTDESIESFEKEYGVNVTIYNFGEEPTMERNLVENPEKFDIVIVSDEYVKKLRKNDMLEEINKRHIPQIKNIGEEFLDKKYDPKNKYSIPYLWGTTGILMNKNYIFENDTWGIFFDDRYSGKVWTLLGPTDAIGVASAYLGYGYVPTELSQLLRIEQFLKLQKSLLFYEEDEGFNVKKISNGTVWASQFYSGDALLIMEENENLTYVIPKEGSAKWIDNFVILKGAKNKNTAELFINHILDPIRSAEISNFTKFPTANIEAIKYIDKNLINLESFNPSAESFDKLFFVSDFDLSEEMEKLNEKLWERMI